MEPPETSSAYSSGIEATPPCDMQAPSSAFLPYAVRMRMCMSIPSNVVTLGGAARRDVDGRQIGVSKHGSKDLLPGILLPML